MKLNATTIVFGRWMALPEDKGYTLEILHKSSPYGSETQKQKILQIIQQGK